MEIISQQVEIKKSLSIEELENALCKYGEPLRWAIVKVTENNFLIDAVFIKEYNQYK